MKEIEISPVFKRVRSEDFPSLRPEDQKGRNFTDVLKHSIEEANVLQNEADHAIQELASGQSKNLHETMILLEKAEISFKLMMQVRNKIVEAYQEIMRMPV